MLRLLDFPSSIMCWLISFYLELANDKLFLELGTIDLSEAINIWFYISIAPLFRLFPSFSNPVCDANSKSSIRSSKKMLKSLSKECCCTVKQPLSLFEAFTRIRLLWATLSSTEAYSYSAISLDGSLITLLLSSISHYPRRWGWTYSDSSYPI